MEVWEKSQTVDPEVRAYIYSLVSAVGGQSTLDARYAVGDDASAVLGDLVRWLKLYDEKTNRLDVKRCMAEANLVQGDLLEIIALWPEEEQESKLKQKLALKCFELLVPLTWPIELQEDRTTVNHVRHLPFLQLAQCGYKRAILGFEDARILRTAVRAVLPSLAESRRERSRRDESIIRLMLYFFRNVVMITQPQDLPSQGDENEISRSATIDAFHEQDVFNFLLTLGSGANDEFPERDVDTLEILFHLLKGIDPKKLFRNQSQVASDETNELKSLMRKEKAMLNQYNKHAPTRHNRFGTMIWVKRGEARVSTMSGQNSITDSHTTLAQMDSSKQVNKPRQRMKKQWEDLTETQEFVAKVELKESARAHLRSFVEDFLDSSFNPLFGSLRKGIESEAPRVGSIHHRQFFYLIYWFLSAEAARREVKKEQGTQSNEENAFAYIAAVLDQETFVLLTRQMQKLYDDKRWQDLQATLLTFTQILLTVQAMAESPDEEDQEIAENIQNRIFYEESTHDLLVSILRNYKNQGFWYLDAVTECIHVFVRMLERYSKANADLQIRSKRKARRKKKEQAEAQGENVDDAEMAAADDQDEYEAQAQVRERKFDFARFSTKFLAQGCVDTFIALLKFYNDLNPDQLKRCHRYLYRLAFKHELGIYLFRVDILQLLHRMTKGPGGLDPASDFFKDIESLVQQVFRRCIKWIERENEGEGWREAAVVEMLFSKIPGTTFYLQNGYEKVIEKRAPRPPAELEIKKSVEEGKRIGLGVSLLLEQGKQDAVEWLKGQLKNAVEERKAWQDGNTAMAEVQRMSGEGEEADNPLSAPEAPTIFISPDSPERKDALFKDKYLRLLLTTLGLQRLGTAEDTEASWIIPSEVSAEQLQEAINEIQKAEFDPPTFDEGTSAQDLIRNKSAGRHGRSFSDSESEEEERELDDDGPMFPPNLPEARSEGVEKPKRKRLTKRNRAELTEAQAEEKARERERREKERNAKIKSQLYVVESDDEDGDEEFYRLEEERRKRMDGIIKSQLRKEAEQGKAKKSKKAKRSADDSDDLDEELRENRKAKTRKTLSGSGDEIEGVEDGDMDIDSEDIPSTPPTPAPLSKEERMELMFQDMKSSSDDSDASPDHMPEDENEDNEKETPSTSPANLPLNEVSGNVAKAAAGSKSGEVVGDGVADEHDEEEDVVKPVPQRRNIRAGFIIEDDSDDE